MTDAHTPGPWDCWDMDEFGWHVFATKFGDRKKGQDCRLSVAAVRLGRTHTNTRDNYYEQVANARLIAAAPELLQELQRSADCLDTFISEHTDPGTEALAALHRARAAIAKARLNSFTKG